MSTIQFLSDLHIECLDDDVNPLDFVTPCADILILAGDIGSLYKIEQLLKFLKSLSLHFKAMLYVPGNHEWYKVPNYIPLSTQELQLRLEMLGDSIDNLYILNRSSVLIGDVCIAGCTLWSKPDCQVPPFIVRIHDVKTKEYEQMHYEDLSYLKEIISYSSQKNMKLLVVTHHPPTYKVLDSVKRRKKYISLYANNLDYLLSKDKVNTWICGHVHTNFDFVTDGGCRVVGNQKGKAKDKVQNFKKDFKLIL